VLSADTVRLFPHDDVHVDAPRFQRLAETAFGTGGIAAAKGALANNGGELLSHDPYAPWADQHRLQLSRLYAELLHQAEDWHRALSDDPTDELAHLALAQRYAESGDRAAALRQLDELDQVMRHELGLQPSEQAASLRRRVLMATPTTPSRTRASVRPRRGGDHHGLHEQRLLRGPHLPARRVWLRLLSRERQSAPDLRARGAAALRPGSSRLAQAHGRARSQRHARRVVDDVPVRWSSE
jgi:DNA-binding SARP family transcriptional activator